MRGWIRLNRRLFFTAAIFFLALRASSGTDFLGPTQLSDTGGHVIQSTVGVDLSLNAYVAWTSGDGMHITIINLGSTRDSIISDPALGSGDPSFITNTVGTTYLVFTQDDPEFGGRDVFMSANTGGIFQEPQNLSESPGDDYAPKVRLDLFGRPHLVWAQQLGNRTNAIYLAPGGQPIIAARDCDYPALAIDNAGIVYIVFTRSQTNQDLYVVNNKAGDGTFGGEVRVTRTPFNREFFPSISVTGSGLAFVAYEQSASLYYQSSTGTNGAFGPPKFLDLGGVMAPELKVTWDYVSIVYEKAGDIYYTIGKVGSDLLNPVSVGALVNSEGAERSPSLAVDYRGFLHLSYIRDGEVYYSNNSGVIQAEFTSDIQSGEVPLQVRFTDLSSGVIESWLWTFGDGSPASIDRNPVHVYTVPGKYDVRLEVSGTGTEASIVKTDYIFVQDASNKLWIPDQAVLPGQKMIYFPVYCFHKEPVKGFQIVGRFDPNILTIQSITSAGTALDLVQTELFAPATSNKPEDPYFFVGAIFDYLPPYDGQVLPPGKDQVLSYLTFDCSKEAPVGGTTVVDLVNGVGPIHLHNVFEIGSVSTLPILRSSIVTIVAETDPPQVPFRRGDIDWNGFVDLSDAIGILGFLFLGEIKPTCKDSLDVNDTGQIDIADAIHLLSYQFLGGTPPAVPFPTPGLDPTEDDLEACEDIQKLDS